MEKQKRWQLFLIVGVIALTLYNIFPTIIFYSQASKSPIDEERASSISTQIINRVNGLENESIAWLKAYNKHLGLSPTSIKLHENDPSIVELNFSSGSQAKVFKGYLSQAGARIPFVPAQLSLLPSIGDELRTTVFVERTIPIHLDNQEKDQIFTFSTKLDADGNIQPLYRKLTHDRTAMIIKALAGTSPGARQIEAIVNNPGDPNFDEMAIAVAREIVDIDRAIESTSPLAERIFARFGQNKQENQSKLIPQFVTRLEQVKKNVLVKKKSIDDAQNLKQQKGELIDSAGAQLQTLLASQVRVLEKSLRVLKENLSKFQQGQPPLSNEAIASLLAEENTQDAKQQIDLSGYDPLIQALEIDWKGGDITLLLYQDVEAIRDDTTVGETEALLKERIDQLIFETIARVARVSDETITPSVNGFRISLDSLTNTQSFLAMHLGHLAKKQGEMLTRHVDAQWNPEHQDLLREAYPIRSFSTYKKQTQNEKRLGLVVYAPAAHEAIPPSGFNPSSLYIIARNMDQIIQNSSSLPAGPNRDALVDDIQSLKALLTQRGFIAYSGASYGIDPTFKNDYIFELNDYYTDLLSATRENFRVKGSHRYAVLDFTDVEQRLLIQNNIDDEIQENLLKWQDEYNAAQVSMDLRSRYLVPPPTKSPFIENLKLSFTKYFRGDERKVLKWGLDLSGGKSVRIGLKDQNNQPVTDPQDLNQAVNELYTRVNKMGVAERTIRTEGSTIVLDFPGSQAFSASELIKASAMYFHIVNEKFQPKSPEIGPVVNSFLQEVWNEAVVTNRTDSENLNSIAWKLMGGSSDSEELERPRSERARILYESGLRFANPYLVPVTGSYNDETSSVVRLRGDDPSEWSGQSHPLMIVFRNFALEGSNLEGVRAGYDPSQGNLLSFNVKSSYEKVKDAGLGSPQQNFYAWTSQFSEERIAGTPKEIFAPRGWRMAILLNGEVISHPSLHAALSNNGSISGRFTQREVNQLAADLKAGSLSFTPHILSEQNVSPELGQEERGKGIFASLIALALVAIAMIGYYRFAGLVATIAVLFNLLLIWGALQSIGAALTLPGIAGIVLTIGMAVDANVLVFERFREEFSHSGRLASAIQAGYRKAFSAIIDSNITTLMAAVILTQFDSGPIKGFAVVLIIGVLSSLFSSLFMTRFFFSVWVRLKKDRKLNMAHLIGQSSFDFLKYAKHAVSLSILIAVIGSFLLIQNQSTIFGMDFTGGYSLTLNVQEDQKADYRDRTQEALLSAGASVGDIEIRELSRPNQLRIQLGISMEEEGHPFYGLPPENPEGAFAYNYEKNPRITWLVNALSKEQIQVERTELVSLDKNWSVMSGQLSDTMRNNAIFALVFALIGILIYITFRFEFKFAVGAVVALAHDIILTLGILAFFYTLGFPVQIDLQVIGAIMTIIGYSLNDTIIIFDRIREEAVLFRKLSFHDVINKALNITLSRTILTSGTTLLVLMSLVLFGGASIFSFAIVMTIGVLVGTFSSLFIAAPATLIMHHKEIVWGEQKAS